MEFKFPQSDERYVQIQGSSELRLNLKLDAAQLSIPFQLFKITTNRNLYMYAKCNKCTAVLKYKRNNESGQFCLTHFQNSHRHRIKNH